MSVQTFVSALLPSAVEIVRNVATSDPPTYSTAWRRLQGWTAVIGGIIFLVSAVFMVVLWLSRMLAPTAVGITIDGAFDLIGKRLWGHLVVGGIGAIYAYAFPATLPKLEPIGEVGHASAVRWVSLYKHSTDQSEGLPVYAANMAAERAASLLDRSVSEWDADHLMLGPVKLTREQLEPQLNSTSELKKIRNRSLQLQATVTSELEGEFAHLTTFLSHIRINTATAAFSPPMPPGGKSWIEASKNAMNHFFYRLVWLRCFLGYPAKALENRKTEVIKLLVDGITRRGKWRKDLEELEKGIDKWFGSQAAAKCVSIEQAALLLPPESWSSSALHRRAEEHGDTSSLSPRLKQQAQVQDLAAWCKIQRHALQNDQVRIKNVLRWLNDEIKWWEGQLNVVKLLHVFRDEHASTPEQVVEFERRLDIVVRQAMSRDGVSPA